MTSKVYINLLKRPVPYIVHDYLNDFPTVHDET